MTFVPTPWEAQWGWQGIVRPSLGSGSAHALPMTDDQKDRARGREKKRRKQPLGFGKR